MAPRPYQRIDFTETFLESLSNRDFSAAERRSFLKALRLLDVDDRHSSLRVHQLHGDRAGSWSAFASQQLRVSFERLPGDRIRMLTCSRHHDR